MCKNPVVARHRHQLVTWHILFPYIRLLFLYNESIISTKILQPNKCWSKSINCEFFKQVKKNYYCKFTHYVCECVVVMCKKVILSESSRNNSNSWGGGCWSRNCFAHCSTHSFHCTFIMISMKEYGAKIKIIFFPRFVSM